MNTSYAPQQEQILVTEAAVTEFDTAPTPFAISQAAQGEDPWAVWPYIWFVDLHSNSRKRFHSFHRRMSAWRMERYNRHQQQRFFTKHGFRPSEEELGLELL